MLAAHGRRRADAAETEADAHRGKPKAIALAKEALAFNKAAELVSDLAERTET
jgi:hypothetical protein